MMLFFWIRRNCGGGRKFFCSEKWGLIWAAHSGRNVLHLTRRHTKKINVEDGQECSRSNPCTMNIDVATFCIYKALSFQFLHITHQVTFSLKWWSQFSDKAILFIYSIFIYLICLRVFINVNWSINDRCTTAKVNQRNRSEWDSALLATKV